MINHETGQVNAWKIAAWLAAAVLFVVVLWAVIASSVWGLQVATAGIYGRGEAHRQIQSAASRIVNYEYFFSWSGIPAASSSTPIFKPSGPLMP